MQSVGRVWFRGKGVNRSTTAHVNVYMPVAGMFSKHDARYETCRGSSSRRDSTTRYTIILIVETRSIVLQVPLVNPPMETRVYQGEIRTKMTVWWEESTIPLLVYPRNKQSRTFTLWLFRLQVESDVLFRVHDRADARSDRNVLGACLYHCNGHDERQNQRLALAFGPLHSANAAHTFRERPHTCVVFA